VISAPQCSSKKHFNGAIAIKSDAAVAAAEHGIELRGSAANCEHDEQQESESNINCSYAVDVVLVTVGACFCSWSTYITFQDVMHKLQTASSC
jgi:hypothetical protein